jgi:hypothetical protein
MGVVGGVVGGKKTFCELGNLKQSINPDVDEFSRSMSARRIALRIPPAANRV